MTKPPIIDVQQTTVIEDLRQETAALRANLRYAIGLLVVLFIMLVSSVITTSGCGS